jgi:hypothetical protein
MGKYSVDMQRAGTMPGAVSSNTGTIANPMVTKDIGISQMMGTTGATGAASNIPSFYQWNPGAGGTASGATGGAAIGTPAAVTQSLAAQASSAYDAAEANGEAKENLNQFSSELVKASAEGSNFCEAISKFGYMQEHSPEMFQQSYIGATSGYTGAAATNSPAVKAQVLGSTKAANTFIAGIKPASTFMVGSATQAGNSLVNSATMAANATTSAAEAARIKGQQINDDFDKTAYSCFDAIDNAGQSASTQLKGGAAAAAAGFGAAGSLFDNVITGSGGKIDASTYKFQTDVGATTDKLSTALTTGAASLNSAATSVNQAAAAQAYYWGGSGAVAGGVGGQTFAQSVGGAGANWGGHSISGGGSWVGSGASYSGWGAQASMAAQQQSSFYGGSGGGGSWNSVSWFADGGVVSRPQIVGVGEAGPEAIIPLSQLQSTMSGLSAMTSGGQMVHTVINIDGKKIADSVGPAVVQRLRQGAGLKVR